MSRSPNHLVELPTHILELIDRGVPVTLEDTNNPLVCHAGNAASFESHGGMSAGSLRHQFIREQLIRLHDKFTHSNEYTIWAGTWNVNGQNVVGSLRSWLRPGGESTAPPDFIFVGLQEIDRTASAYLVSVSSKESYWLAYLLSELESVFPEEEYVLVISKSLVGIYAVMFAKSQHQHRVRNMATSATACGLMGMIGNKGGVALRVKIDAEYVVFVNVHLAPHVDNVHRRNQDYADLTRGLIFSPSPSSSAAAISHESGSLLHSWNEPDSHEMANIWDCRCLIWAGDLNYRIAMDPKETLNLALTGEYGTLLSQDQLSQEIDEGHAFEVFTEAPITFPPTFKYNTGSDSFDSGENPRAPAYTDRVLWRQGDPLNALNYYSAMDIRSSDHKPVAAYFKGTIREVDPAKFDPLLLGILHQADDFENDAIPTTKLSTNLIAFDELRFRQPHTRLLEMVNTGRTIAKFTLSPSDHKNSNNSSSSNPVRWLQLSPQQGYVLPGASVEIRLCAYVDAKSAQALNAQGKGDLHEILILHVEGGRDHFVSVDAHFKGTIFCRDLAQVSDPAVICSLPTDNNETVLFHGVPIPIIKMIQFIITYGLATENLFLESGDGEMVLQVQEALDEDRAIPEAIGQDPVGLASVAECLLRYLDCLTHPVIPFALLQPTASMAKRRDSAIEDLPPANKNTFHYLMHFIKYQLLPANPSLRPEDIACVFGRVLIKESSLSTDRLSRNHLERHDSAKTAVVLHYITQ